MKEDEENYLIELEPKKSNIKHMNTSSNQNSNINLNAPKIGDASSGNILLISSLKNSF
jgi:hypothetical protein